MPIARSTLQQQLQAVQDAARKTTYNAVMLDAIRTLAELCRAESALFTNKPDPKKVAEYLEHIFVP